MNNRKYKSDPQQLLEEGRKVMLTMSSEDSMYRFRVFAVNMVLSGDSAVKVAELSGVSRKTVTKWVKSSDENGFESLRTQKQTGRPSKLTDSQREEIDSALESDPTDHGFKIWDGPGLSSHIHDKYGITFLIRGCQRLFHALGYALIHPQPYPSKDYEDTQEREDFKKRIHELKHDDSVVVVYQDEVSFQQPATSATMWCKKGSAPKVKSFTGRRRVSYSGFVNPETGALHVTSPDKFNYETTIEAIRSLLKDCPLPEARDMSCLWIIHHDTRKPSGSLTVLQIIPTYRITWKF